MGRRPRCSSVTYQFRYAPSNAGPARTALPAAHFERNDLIIICETVHQCMATLLWRSRCVLSSAPVVTDRSKITASGEHQENHQGLVLASVQWIGAIDKDAQ